MLMLAHKGISYRTVEFPSGAHPLLVRACGFPGSPTPIRSVDGAAHRELSLLDRLGTVPALRLGEAKVQTNRAIARFLDRVEPDPTLFPLETDRRHAVEEVERWGDDVLQMAARRVALATSARGLDALHMRGGQGRLGPLLSRSEITRDVASRIARHSFRAGKRNEAEILSAVAPMLDRVDGWIAGGLLCGKDLNVADFMIAPSLALLTYRPELAAQIARRPAGRLVDRLLPEPAS
jgi:glutathione S-transferase